MQDAHPQSLATLLADGARLSPKAPALVDGARTLDFATLADMTSRRAGTLATCRYPPGALLALAAPADELAAALLASQWAGHPFLPLDPATASLRWPTMRAATGAAARQLDDAPAATAPPVPPAAPPATAPALVVATSGSEGPAKGVVLPHAALNAAARAGNARIALAAGDVWLNCLPLHHIGGLMIFWRCFAAGAAVRLHTGFDAGRVWADIADGRATHLSLVPAMLAKLLDTAGGRPPPPSFRCLLVGGAALSRPLRERARATGWPLHVSYGMSETAAQIAVLGPDEPWHEGCVGRPLPGVAVAIGPDGRIRMRGPQRMSGYLGAPALADDDWLTTGDLGEIDASGRLLVLGRADDILVSAGINIQPAEVEALLAACPGIGDVAVTATRDPLWGDVLTALFVGNAEQQAIDAWCREHLPPPFRPRRLLRVEHLPRNAMGKLARQCLPEMLASAREAP